MSELWNFYELLEVCSRHRKEEKQSGDNNKGIHKWESYFKISEEFWLREGVNYRNRKMKKNLGSSWLFCFLGGLIYHRRSLIYQKIISVIIYSTR